MIPQGHQDNLGRATHEERDVDAPGLLLIVGLLFLLLFVSFLVCWGALHILERGQGSRVKTTAAAKVRAVSAPSPGLLVHPGKEWNNVRATEQRELTTYGWVDRPAGLARIPIKRAMQILVKQGLPEVGAGQTRSQLMQGRAETDSYSNEYKPSPMPGTTP